MKNRCNLCGSNGAFSVLFHPEPVSQPIPLVDRYHSSSQARITEPVYRCSECGLVFLGGSIDDCEILEAYTKAEDRDYVSQASYRVHSFKKSVRRLNRYFKRTGLSKTIPRVLDVGAAAGFFVKAASDLGWDAQGIEPNEWLRQWGAQNLKVSLHAGTLESALTAFPRKFDLLTFWDVLEHLPDPRRALRNANSILEDGGFLVINYPDISSAFAKLSGSKWWFLHSAHLFYFTPGTMGRYLRDQGFEIVKIDLHFQTLSLDYLLVRAQVYTPRAAKVIRRVIARAGLGGISIPYYASQKCVLARKVREAS